MNTKRKLNKKILAVTAVALAAAVCGFWMLTAPSREQAYVYAAQESLVEDLMRDIYRAETSLYVTQEIEAMPDTEEHPADDLAYEVPEAEGYTFYEHENDYIPAYEPTVDYDPIPDNAFPAAIIGIGILTIESIDLRLPIAEGVEYATLRIAPGRVPQTARIGDVGNAVIAGHRNYTFGSMFNRLGEVEIGDIVQYQARSGEMMAFEVFEIAVIEPYDQIAFLQPVNDSIITLYTCTPIRAATHRLIIRAQRIY